MHGLLCSHRCDPMTWGQSTTARPSNRRIQYHRRFASRFKARTMTEPTLTCPTCRTEIKLTESLAAPLIEDTRRRYEDQLTRKEADIAGREAAIRRQQE